MNSKKKCLIITIILWTLTILLMIIPVKDCIYNYQNGVNSALEGVDMIYGKEAISYTLSFFIAFFFPVFIIWILILLASIILTTVTIIRYKKKK